MLLADTDFSTVKVEITNRNGTTADKLTGTAKLMEKPFGGGKWRLATELRTRLFWRFRMKTLAIVFGSILLAAHVQCGTAGQVDARSEVPLTKSSVQGSGRLVIHVDANAGPGGDGSGRFPFDNIADALTLAGSLGGAVVVVEPGQYPVSSTLRIQSSIQLRGSNVMEVDDADRPTGSIVPGTETRIVGTAALGTNALLSVAPTDGGVLHGVEIRNFTFDSGQAHGDDLSFNRTQGYSVYENLFTGLATNGIFSVASSGKIVGNYISNDVTGAAVAAGYPESPSAVEFVGNRVVGNIAGLVLIGSTSRVPETGDELDVVVRNNDLSENNKVAGFSFGLRIFTINRPLGAPGDTQFAGNVRATIQGNRIADNQIGVTIDAGFPFRRVGTTCDPRAYSGRFDLEFRGNTLSGSLFIPSLITFTRNQAALHQFPLDLWQYLHSATFDITDEDGTLADALIDHPELDPLVGPCANDATHELLGNTLIYNGTVLPHTP